MTAKRLQENYHFCVQAYLQEKGIRYFNKYVLQHKNDVFSIKDWLYADVDKPTTLELIKMLDNEKIIKLRKSKALLEIQKKFYWFPVVKKIILDTGITRDPDEYMYDILWGVSDSRIVRDEEGVEEREEEEKEREKREREEREKKEKEEREKKEKKEREEREKKEKEEREKREKEEREEREERARINKYKNMETSEMMKRLQALQKITQPTEEEKKELARLITAISIRSFSGRGY